MTYSQARYIAITKRLLGWVIFIPAFLSTLASVVNLVWLHGVKGDGIHAVLNDFLKMMADVIKFNTPFLDVFWRYSPTPDYMTVITGANVSFLVIYFLMFVGLAMSASGLRIYRQFKFIKEQIEDHMILEKAKESGVTQEQLEAKVKFPRHSLFSQIFTLYISPIIIAAIAYFLSKLLGW
ncbi:YniB family protein [Xenorhabdus bharatensis]|uniref:YniB family protein n=1 Tax=Xenorhabdus bharatensis TaxID=3136256 RepID=UPI0030F45E79